MRHLGEHDRDLATCAPIFMKPGQLDHREESMHDAELTWLAPVRA